LQQRDSQNRYPGLVLLRSEHLALAQKRLTIKLDMPPPELVMEVVSPGKTSRDRDYVCKRAQYANIGIPEYWIIDPKLQAVLVLVLEDRNDVEHGTYQGKDAIVSPTVPTLNLTAEQIFAAAQ
jgi:Uma2 family endonuclease